MATLLKDAITEAGISVRALARTLAGDDADDKRLESVRRQVNKWLTGTQPERAQAERLSEVLEKPQDYFVRPITRVPYREQLAAKDEEIRQLRERLAAHERQR